MRVYLALALIGSISTISAREHARVDDASSIAWVAFSAAESGDRSQVPVLERALSSLQDGRQSEQRLALHAVLDALVRLDAKPPPDGLAKVFATHPVETVLMLNRFGAERDGTVLPLCCDIAKATAGSHLQVCFFRPALAGSPVSCLRIFPFASQSWCRTAPTAVLAWELA